MDLKNNPHFQHGVYVGNNVIKHIETTTYGTIETALERKKELVKDLKEQFGWDETHKDVAETLGIIHALEQEQKLIESQKIVLDVTTDDVIEKAEEIGIKLSEEMIETVLGRLPTADNLEDIINEVRNEL